MNFPGRFSCLISREKCWSIDLINFRWSVEPALNYCVLPKIFPPTKLPHKVAQDFSSQKHPAHKTRTRLYLGKVCWAPKVAGSSAQDPSTRRAQDHPKKCPKPTISAEHYAQDAHNIRTTPRTRRLRLANILESAQDVRTRRAHKTERTRLRTRPSAQDNLRRQRNFFR